MAELAEVVTDREAELTAENARLRQALRDLSRCLAAEIFSADPTFRPLPSSPTRQALARAWAVLGLPPRPEITA